MTDWYTLAAIVIGPIAAVAVQLWFQKRKDRRDVQLSVFRSLMGQRRSPLTAEFVYALNQIDVAFYGCNEVTDAWAALLAFVSDPSKFHSATQVKDVEARNDLVATLLSKMAKELGFEYDFSALKNRAYRPQHYDNEQIAIELLRERLSTALVDGKLAVKVVDDGPLEHLKPPGLRPANSLPISHSTGR